MILMNVYVILSFLVALNHLNIFLERTRIIVHCKKMNYLQCRHVLQESKKLAEH